MAEMPKQLLAPALPNICVQLIRENASSETFVTLPALRDMLMELAAKHYGWRPQPTDMPLLYRRVWNALPTVQDIDSKVKVVEDLTLRKTKIIKIYYHV